jgi:hypothetical protein
MSLKELTEQAAKECEEGTLNLLDERYKNLKSIWCQGYWIDFESIRNRYGSKGELMQNQGGVQERVESAGSRAQDALGGNFTPPQTKSVTFKMSELMGIEDDSQGADTLRGKVVFLERIGENAIATGQEIIVVEESEEALYGVPTFPSESKEIISLRIAGWKSWTIVREWRDPRVVGQIIQELDQFIAEEEAKTYVNTYELSRAKSALYKLERTWMETDPEGRKEELKRRFDMLKVEGPSATDGAEFSPEQTDDRIYDDNGVSIGVESAVYEDNKVWIMTDGAVFFNTDQVRRLEKRLKRLRREIETNQESSISIRS